METVFGADRVTYAQGAPFVAELPVAVPRTAFPGGLTASFYNSADFSGPVVATRTVKEIDTNWARIDPAPGVDRKTFSVRWQGMLTVPGGRLSVPARNAARLRCRRQRDRKSTRLNSSH